ncbi:hypothetical protein K227x_01080 [Rubripirellula lacrimiformis]|uniref:SGNH hydrolase-type esterase domain-containing protein n=1 Tax=Rubripirellula lacrimiformis TaxID=1930273 RepID=A0A517N3M3_9BACT|nr:GDSL-type esterase/lipase family protein [Rubripirellula lacrimiformis]QDT01741.1 hypothetical protein K227x_01080 [Rubripirellula lacrimiformis]
MCKLCFPVWVLVAVLLGTPVGYSQSAEAVSDPVVDEPLRAAAIERWEKDIAKLEALDGSQPANPDAVLLLGSSSIRRWDSAATDLSPYRVIPRGYGGAKYSDLAVFAQRLIQPHQYRAVVIFVGNDISGNPGDHSVAQVDRWTRHVIEVSRRHQPDAAILLVEVTPTQSRIDAWPQIRTLNAQLREIALSTPMVFFVDTAAHFLDPQGKPRQNLFVDDQLHLNATGYQIWGAEIRRHLDDSLRLIQRDSESSAD